MVEVGCVGVEVGCVGVEVGCGGVEPLSGALSFVQWAHKIKRHVKLLTNLFLHY